MRIWAPLKKKKEIKQDHSPRGADMSHDMFHDMFKGPKNELSRGQGSQQGAQHMLGRKRGFFQNSLHRGVLEQQQGTYEGVSVNLSHPARVLQGRAAALLASAAPARRQLSTRYSLIRGWLGSSGEERDREDR